MSYKNDICIIGCALLALAFLTNIGLGLECTNCHTNNGKEVTAKDTIAIGNDTCLKCHNPDYPPTPIGYNTHLVHVGKFSVNTDFLKKHPNAIESLSCDNCHKQIFDCKSCHIKNIPHIDPPLGYNCQGCHGEIDKLFLHPAIKLKIHDIFDTGSDNKTACTMCHNPDVMTSLKLANGDAIPIEESYKLCHQCHSTYYNLWNDGSHYSSKKKLPTENVDYNPNAVSQEDAERDWQKQNACVNCHNPHNPRELYQLPTQEVKNAPTSVVPNYLYILIGIIVICAIVIILKKLKTKDKKLKTEDENSKTEDEKPKTKYGKLKLSDIRNISLPSLPKTLKDLIPISISVSEIEKAENDNVSENKIEKTGKDDIPENKIEENKNTGKSEFLHKYKKDILILSFVVAILFSFFIIFGNFIPIKVIASESMSPHINKGDIIFYTSIDRVSSIKTYSTEGKGDGYESFGDYGEVIMYKPFGDDTIGPYVHRAMYYVEKGKEMWPGGPQAPHSGYITKGDNKETNKGYDQQMDLSYNQPVKKEWIVGIPKYRIPYLGYIRIMLP